jgi:hypothetical protein
LCPPTALCLLTCSPAHLTCSPHLNGPASSILLDVRTSEAITLSAPTLHSRIHNNRTTVSCHLSLGDAAAAVACHRCSLGPEEGQKLLAYLPTSSSHKESRGLVRHLLASPSACAHVATCAGYNSQAGCQLAVDAVATSCLKGALYSPYWGREAAALPCTPLAHAVVVLLLKTPLILPSTQLERAQHDDSDPGRI